MGVFPGPEPNTDIPIWTPVPEWSTSIWKKSRGRRNRERQARQKKKEQKREKREKRLEEEKILRDWLREWQGCRNCPRCAPGVAKKKGVSNHEPEKVTKEVRRVLGRSFKAKISSKDTQRKIQEKRDQAEKMRRLHKEQEETKYKPGSRKAIHEDRRVKAKLEKKRKLRMTRKLPSKVKEKEEELKVNSDKEVLRSPGERPDCEGDVPDLTNDEGETSSEGETDSSDDDEENYVQQGARPIFPFSELHNTIFSLNNQLASRPTIKYTDLGGGGNPYQGTSQSIQEAQLVAMLKKLEAAIVRTGLPLKLDRRTLAEGNCFPHSVVQQCQRPHVKEALERQGRKIVTDIMDLRRNVRQFVLDNKDHPRILAMKENFEQKQGQLARELKPTRGWLKYWKDMVKPGEWVDDTFVQMTAFFLGLPIFLVPTGSASYTRLYHPISCDFESSTVPSPEPSSLWIGYINDQHYQSLLLNDEDQSVSRCPSPQGVDEALSRAFAQIQLELERGQVGCLLSGKYLKTPFKILIGLLIRCRHQRQLPNQLT